MNEVLKFSRTDPNDLHKEMRKYILGEIQNAGYPAPKGVET
jgi:hypothetical protein